MKKKGVSKINKIILGLILVGGFAGFLFFKFNGGDGIDKKAVIINSLSTFEKIAQFLPIEKDTKKEISAVDQLVEAFLRNDDIERSYFVLLQNNMELRPGGGFLGQYAVIKVKNGDVTSVFVEDANLLDQRITAKVSPPYPFTRMMS